MARWPTRRCRPTDGIRDAATVSSVASGAKVGRRSGGTKARKIGQRSGTDGIGGANRPRSRAKIDGAPAKNQIAIRASKIMQPNDDVDMNGQIGWPYRWCT